MKLCVLFGIPASGKTTFARKLSKDGWLVHSYDDTRIEYGNHYTTVEIDKIFFSGMKHDLLSGYDVVCDCKCVSADARKRILREFSDILCHKTLVAIVTPVDECIRRNALREGAAQVPKHHIEMEARYMQPPTKDEGWDEIFIHKN